PQTPVALDEGLLLIAAKFEIRMDQPLHALRDLIPRQRPAHALADRSVIARTAAQSDLIPLLAVLIDAENADVTDAVVSTAIHASADRDADRTNLVLCLERIEPPVDVLRHPDRARIRQAAEIQSRAAHDVGDQPDVGRRQLRGIELAPDFVEVALGDVGQHQILIVRRAQLPEAVRVADVGQGLELLRGAIARHVVRRLERHEDHPVARLLVRPDIALDPSGKSGVTRGYGGDVGADLRGRAIGGLGEISTHALDVLRQEQQLLAFDARVDLGVFLLDGGAEALDAPLAQHDLDARLVDVVP